MLVQRDSAGCCDGGGSGVEPLPRTSSLGFNYWDHQAVNNDSPELILAQTIVDFASLESAITNLRVWFGASTQKPDAGTDGHLRLYMGGTSFGVDGTLVGDITIPAGGAGFNDTVATQLVARPPNGQTYVKVSLDSGTPVQLAYAFGLWILFADEFGNA